MPPVKVIEVCDWLITHTPDLRIQLAGKELDFQSGKQLSVRNETQKLMGTVKRRTTENER